MGYQFTELKEEFHIQRIVSIHYFEYMSDFTFPGESHYFWELLCVDKGEVGIQADHESLVLQRGDIIFHKPNEFHALAANGIVAPNLVVIGFDCHDPAMSFFRDKVLTVGEEERNLLAQVISEAKNAFSGPLDDPYQLALVRKSHAVFGAEQIIKVLLELLLIQLCRRFSIFSTARDQKREGASGDYLYQGILAYLETHICSQLTVEDISKDNLISSSQLKKLFREKNQCGVIDHFIKMKIDLAKQLIRSRQMNFTQIADYLGYSSIHYFSRQFKKETGMSPSEYIKSIKQLSERPLSADTDRTFSYERLPLEAPQ